MSTPFELSVELLHSFSFVPSLLPSFSIQGVQNLWFFSPVSKFHIHFLVALLRPSPTINQYVVACFIGQSIPDLTQGLGFIKFSFFNCFFGVSSFYTMRHGKFQKRSKACEKFDELERRAVDFWRTVRLRRKGSTGNLRSNLSILLHKTFLSKQCLSFLVLEIM